jgi:dual 3',5'-cyclic-AMP and -GMP phosphodiesterase 11
MPVKNAYDEVIAVAQVINKNPDIDNGQFTEKDEQVTYNLTYEKYS